MGKSLYRASTISQVSIRASSAPTRATTRAEIGSQVDPGLVDFNAIADVTCQALGQYGFRHSPAIDGFSHDDDFSNAGIGY
jgi:hypothetical protein